MVKMRLILLCLTIFAGVNPAIFAQENNQMQTLISGALEDFEEKDFDKALAKLQEAEKLEPNSPFVLNLIGAAYTKKKEYASAKQYFDKSLEAQPGFFPSLFNLGELLFLQKQYPQALEYFTKMLARDPGNELLQFKVILCLILTDQVEDAQKLVKRMKLPGEGPAWYYAQAALDLKLGNKRKASSNLSTAKELFRDKISLYSETFEDLGWPTK